MPKNLAEIATPYLISERPPSQAPQSLSFNRGKCEAKTWPICALLIRIVSVLREGLGVIIYEYEPVQGKRRGEKKSKRHLFAREQEEFQ